MRALITGASGYIGNHLARRLLAEGWEVCALTRRTSDLRGVEGLTRLDGAESADSIRAAVERARPDVVYHLAAEAATTGTTMGESMRATNIDLGTTVLDAMLAGPCRRFVDAGTYWEYATDGSFETRTAYARSKRAFHEAIAGYGARGVSVTTLVLFDVYGPHDWRGKFIPSLLKTAREGRELPMSPGEQRLEMVHVDDVVAGFVLTAEIAEPGYRAYALDGGERHTLRTIVGMLGEACGKPVRAVWGGLEYRAEQIMEPVIVRAGGPLARLPGWRAHISLREGLRQVAAAEP